MTNKLEKILTGTILIAGGLLLGWINYDSLNSKREIEKEAKSRGIDIYEVCKEKGRSDVLDMIEVEQGLKNIRYIRIGKTAVPLYR